jgi:glutathione synthase/RimK-type ligase-like ATP-grasp enzyme
VLKRPDSSFSAGVVRVSNQDELKSRLADFFEQSDLVVAQEFMPSAFDWRVGVLNGRAFYACKYHMAKGHWQIIARDSESDKYGRVEAVALEAVPTRVRDVAVRAASHIGDGLYGIDVKEVHGRHVVMEINDNPSIEAGYEDGVVKDDLYLDVMKLFRERLDARGRKAG